MEKRNPTIVWNIYLLPLQKLRQKTIRELSPAEFSLLIGKTSIIMGWAAHNLPTDTAEFPARSFFLSKLKKAIGHFTLKQFDEGLQNVLHNRHGFDERLFGQQINIKWFLDMMRSLPQDRRPILLGYGFEDMTGELKDYCRQNNIHFTEIDYPKLAIDRKFKPENFELITGEKNQHKALKA